ncbi:hypothetical protein WJX73_005944 [Symbiochloris irregularis]|uniref:Hflx-type G domain-containing protein n=1 Tax=Symbiochloris irregularis TaxID=706552 RepID=A0AAW1NFU2_9CHLO
MDFASTSSRCCFGHQRTPCSRFTRSTAQLMHALPVASTRCRSRSAARCQAQKQGAAPTESATSSSDGDRAWADWEDEPNLPPSETVFRPELGDGHDAEPGDAGYLADTIRANPEEAEAEARALRAARSGNSLEEEVAYLVGVQLKGGNMTQRRDTAALAAYSIEESLEELGRLATTAGLKVAGQLQQQLEAPDPRTYIGPGKLKELRSAMLASNANIAIFDDELSPRVARALQAALGEDVRLCDRTALILDIFSQRAASHEGKLQVQLAQSQYELPRLTRMWSHLERQAGGGGGGSGGKATRGMGEKQKEVDKRLLRTQIAGLKRQIEDVRRHRGAIRSRRTEGQVPVVALVGYTNAGKSSLLNRLTGAGALAEDKLFATLDPTTRKLELPAGTEALLSDTVGFIQKLPTQLVAAFRATLEEIKDAAVILHVVDVSHPNAAAQSASVMKVLQDLGVGDRALVTVWNKVDACSEPAMVQATARERESTCATSAATGEGIGELHEILEAQLAAMLQPVQCLVPYSQAELVGEVHRRGLILQEAFSAEGTLLQARVPVALAGRLQQWQLDSEDFQDRSLAAQELTAVAAGT